ncbi:membrane protein insertase YidC [Oceanobacillus polygoni]|uniref:Membrane protein insertase YidC n=1 Tax=Oceanobacillus polygoni TaxID=1235259 RepID=A0A9X1CFM7_9BACI|nr:membrane protein insertase YidC [Oceanobacillus polygoni]MBP2076827.1 YidC/Oxa1 family membrane protein insertase [Oceanobacillus polygoni]
MESTSVFIKLKKYSFIILGLLSIVLLAGCQGATEPISANSTGWFDHYFVYTFSVLIKGLAGFFNDNYGLSIILLTLFIRLALMPIMLKQIKNNAAMKEKMNVLKPEMDAIQGKYRNKQDVEEQKKMQSELMQLYGKHQVNPLASLGGCLPMLIQFPILIGFYYAILRTPEIASHSFLWFNLGQSDIILTMLAVIIYFFQFKVSLIGMEPKMKKQMTFMGLLSPIMIGVISLNAPAALPLYWAVGGIFMIVQQLIAKKMYNTYQKDKKPAEA